MRQKVHVKGLLQHVVFLTAQVEDVRKQSLRRPEDKMEKEFWVEGSVA